jgi:XRE family aerobic/anaerobic benzoate catabolism transcriptional regulator
MTQRLLAARSGVSERHIALLEAGMGNISILLLRRLAQALGTDVAALAADRPEPPLELVMLEQTLAQLPPSDLARARLLLMEHFAAPSTRLRRSRIALVGLRGAGKSSLGRRLAELRGVRFVELDREVEREGRMELRELFELHGQQGFRALEYRALQGLIDSGEKMVIATGGSLVTEPRTYELLLANCLTVWVRAAPEEHMQRVIAQGDLRPMANDGRDMDDLRAILASREALYGKADLQLDTSGRPFEASLEQLARLVGGAAAAALSDR